MYAKFIKRPTDFILSLLALIMLSPILIVLIILGTVGMKGNPFFAQLRPGKNEKIFKLIKFRTMTNAKDDEGNLLPDTQRMTKFGSFLRKSSLDELPELINILKGDMSIVGPRPLLVKYLPYYTEHENQRHKVRPGLTGWAQIHGRNSIESWEERFEYDVEYVNNIKFSTDVKIILLTVKNVFTSDGIVVPGLKDDFDEYRRKNLVEYDKATNQR